ncbi:DUF4198 domain-containing protein [Rhodovarius crocodyli]|uniref:DUF4198 domain-containing protein n=1 Tax=Rhodovarius crocodyli TaxID=1979269 RepID=A0A437MJN6_9PROT|nr:DUF4198 domain-containing protein [Rhodovarius crocodyli]RVT97805.1 DUF4198 domain-containing protein [Rhodovarius crocodyli]
MIRWMPLAAMLLAAAPVAAHQIWLEREGQTARAYFGEPVEGVRERTGGLLDRVPGPRSFTTDVAAATAMTRGADHFSATLPAGTGDVRLIEDGFPPFGREEKTKAIMLAREGRAETRHAMDLEIVPVTAGGNEFTVMLRGQPLPRAEVTVVAPPRWERRLQADAQGRVRFDTPWAGRYVAEVIHTDPTPGGTGDGAYQRIRFVSTLSFTVQEGIAWTGQR